MQESSQPIGTPLPQRIEDFKHRTLPMVVWSVAALVVVGLLVARARQVQYIGIAQAPEYEVSVSANGTVETVVVDLFDNVESGDVLAKLDDKHVLASIDTATAGIRQLQAELEAERIRLLAGAEEGMADWRADLRRFQIDEERRRLDILALRVILEGDQIELERHSLELQRSRPLRDGGLLSSLDFEALQLEYNQVHKRIDENEVLLSQMQEEYRAAQDRRRNYEEQLPPRRMQQDSVLQPLIEAIAVESRRLGEIELQREALVLRSPVVGQVSQVLCRTGQSVVPGEPIVMIAERSVREIVAYLNEGDDARIAANTPVVVTGRGRPASVAESVVVRVAPAIQALPQRLWRDPRTPDYGRAVIIAAAPAMKLTPGELVDIKFLAK